MSDRKKQTSPFIESKLQWTLNSLNTIFPLGVSNLVVGYFVDEVTITAEYHLAAFEGDVSLMERIDKEYREFLTLSEQDFDSRAEKLFDLLISALNNNSLRAATYLQERVKQEGGFWRPLTTHEADDESKVRFIVDMADEKQLKDYLDRALNNSNDTFIRIILQSYPHLFEAKDIPQSAIASINMAYTLLRYGDRKKLGISFAKDLMNIVFVDPCTCMFLYVCSLDYKYCPCRKFFLAPTTASMCHDCKTKQSLRKQIAEKRTIIIEELGNPNVVRAIVESTPLQNVLAHIVVGYGSNGCIVPLRSQKGITEDCCALLNPDDLKWNEIIIQWVNPIDGPHAAECNEPWDVPCILLLDTRIGKIYPHIFAGHQLNCPHNEALIRKEKHSWKISCRGCDISCEDMELFDDLCIPVQSHGWANMSVKG